ncbi:hypothetical protein Vafri_6566 [Volvox africanus]|uniref:Uncharacterized protein n=1 Tax=Volvox africanus TaxID=51714 RepID=A0A8J4EZQ3_9CHLO|nr:hypothetical protein Vafri_6566 [Volvox africanus]
MQIARRSRPVAHQALRGMLSRRTITIFASQKEKQPQDAVKTLHLMRHGITEMNEYLALHRYDAEDFKDPMMYDTVLTIRGKAGAQAAAQAVKRLSPKPEVLLRPHAECRTFKSGITTTTMSLCPAVSISSMSA